MSSTWINKAMLWGTCSIAPLGLSACGYASDSEMLSIQSEDEIHQTTQQFSNDHRQRHRKHKRRHHRHAEGRRLFEEETFGGNGRTCSSCHTKETGTISPEQIQQLFADNPDDPLFRAIDSDDGFGSDYERLKEHGTIRVHIPLPPGITLVDDPTATTVSLFRGIPGTLNTPALDPVLMYDGRQPDVPTQAGAAVEDHYQAAMQPTERQKQKIANFQMTRPFFSSRKLWRYSKGGPAPRLPQGDTASEKRGRIFFEDTPEGLCAHCHSGPMLNETNEFFLGPEPVGTRFFAVLVSAFNTMGNHEYDFAFENPDDPANPTIITSPDPGLALITGKLADVNAFKINSLWDIKNSAPYFHDNSAKNLEELMDHYAAYFAGPPLFRVLTDEEKADMVAFMLLL